MKGGSADTRSTLGALGVVLMLLVGVALLPRVLRSLAGAGVGRDAPEFRLSVVANGTPAQGGNELSLGALRGRPVLLDFWATWCEPCRIEAPIVDRVARRWRDRDLVVVGVNTDTPDQGDPRAFARSYGLSYPIVRDDQGSASHAYGVEELPTLVMISRTGKVLAVRTGIADDAELERPVRQAL
jgi:thiol-disulfide isomerase/thioredoxin